MSKPGTYALVIADGHVPDKRICEKLTKHASTIACADGGADWARRRGIRPDIIVGDLDSVRPSTLKAFRASRIVLNVSRDSTDLEKTLDVLMERPLRKVIVLGATGRRTDHLLTNFSILKKYSGRLDLRFIDDQHEFRILPRRTVLRAQIGELITLFPLGSARGITTTGLRYALNNDTLEIGVREGQSNEATERRITISYKAGSLLLARFHGL